MANLKNPVKAIHAFCVECMSSGYTAVRDCPNGSCILYPFRTGKNPYRTRTMSEEEKRATAERLQRAREAKKKEAQYDQG